MAEAEARLAVGAFGPAATAARRALAILDGGELLEDEPYAAWAQGPRRRAARLQRRARSGAWTAALELGDTASALDAATAAVDADPFDEDAHRALMRANHRRGDRGAALVVFKRLERELHDELGVAPADETLELYEAIVGGRPEPEARRRTGVGGGLGGVGSGGGHRAGREVPLVGRRQELYLLREAWAGAVAARCEFVFVSGPAGSGKSRLAAATAAVAEAAGGVTLRARCNEAERSLFLQPIVEAVRGHLETVSAEVAAELVGSWAGTLAELLPGLTMPSAFGPWGRARCPTTGPVPSWSTAGRWRRSPSSSPAWPSASRCCCCWRTWSTRGRRPWRRCGSWPGGWATSGCWWW